MGLDYKSSGVDIEAGYRSVELMKEYVRKTMRPEVMGGLGGFSGAFSLAKIKEMEKPVLLSGTDGVGTKLKIAFLMDKHDTVGIDCVAMCADKSPLVTQNCIEQLIVRASGLCADPVERGHRRDGSALIILHSDLERLEIDLT